MNPGREYLEIALRRRRLVPGWVEGYAGPAELRTAVDAGEADSVQELRDRVDALAEGVERPELELAGEQLDYPTLFERCHGAPVALVPEAQFEQAHAILDRALPGPGAVATRYRAWRDTQRIPVERLQESLERLAGEMRARCRELFGLPDGEQVTSEVAGDEPWAGNAEDLGHRKTRVRINADLPISSPRLLELVCHEAYPGHHTEAVCKDAALIKPLGREELAVYVYPSPQAVIAEGLACHAIEALLGEDAERVASDRLRPIGIAYDH